MEGWKATWTIIDEQVTCRACGRRQSVDQARSPFRHDPGCPLLTPAVQLPWRDLAVRLRQERSGELS